MNRLTLTGKLRALDPKKDLARVADLVEDAFGLKADPEGSAVVRQMRSIHSYYNSIPFSKNWLNYPGGFVWEERGQVIGNISLIPFRRGFKRIYLIANVAVEPEYRGQGIARALTQQALRYLRQWGKPEIWLEVRSDNEIAIGMYERLGFKFFKALSQWEKPAHSDPNPSSFLAEANGAFQLQIRKLKDWPEQQEWLEWAYPTATRWYESVAFPLFSPYAWLNPLRWGNLTEIKHYRLTKDGSLSALLSVLSNQEKTDKLWLALPQTADLSMRLKALLQKYLQDHWLGRRLFLEFPKDRGTEAFEQAGFRKLRDLNWMHY